MICTMLTLLFSIENMVWQKKGKKKLIIKSKSIITVVHMSYIALYCRSLFPKSRYSLIIFHSTPAHKCLHTLKYGILRCITSGLTSLISRHQICTFRIFRLHKWDFQSKMSFHYKLTTSEHLKYSVCVLQTTLKIL